MSQLLASGLWLLLVVSAGLLAESLNDFVLSGAALAWVSLLPVGGAGVVVLPSQQSEEGLLVVPVRRDLVGARLYGRQDHAQPGGSNHPGAPAKDEQKRTSCEGVRQVVRDPSNTSGKVRKYQGKKSE